MIKDELTSGVETRFLTAKPIRWPAVLPPPCIFVTKTATDATLIILPLLLFPFV